MSLEEKAHGQNGAGEEMTPDLELALREFRLSILAWSEAALSRPRLASAATPRRRLWRLAAGWAMSSVLIAGGLSAGVFEHHLQQVKVAQARIAVQQRLAAEQQAQQARQEDEELLAKVDNDVSRTVPSAMEPLAQLMAEDESK